MADRQFGPYRLVRQIAVGGMAEIYLAKTDAARGPERFVALKMIHPNFAEDDQFIAMLIDEARISIQLHHPNIAHTFDLGRYGETYYLIMEYVDGADLYKILRRGSERDVVTPVDVAAFVVKEVAHGLDYAHQRADEQGRPLQIIHRDVSPQNVIVAYDGGVKLVDFGIAKAASKAQQTAAGVIKGKYYYMSPEQALGEPLDPRTDVFSVGIVLYELLSGQMLYLEEDVQRLLDRVRRADIPSIRTLRRDVPSQLDRIVMRALARRREDRYQTAGDLAGDLERFLDVFAPAFSPRKMVDYMKDALGEAAAPLLPSTAPPAPAPAPRRAPRTTAPPVRPVEISDENSMLFRVADLAGNDQRRPAAAPAPAPARRPAAPARGGDQRTAPIASRPDVDDDVDSTMVSSRPSRDQLADEPPTSAAGPRGVRRAAPAARAAPPPSIDLGDFEPTVIEQAPPTDAPAADDFPLDPDDDGPTFTRDAAPIVAIGDASTARGRAAAGQPPGHPPALAARTAPPAVSQVRRPRESRRTPPGGTGAPSVLQAIVGQPSAAHPRPARGAGAPISDGVPAPVPEPATSGAATSPGGGRGGVPVGRGLSLGVQAGPLDPAFDAPTSPGTIPSGQAQAQLQGWPGADPYPPGPPSPPPMQPGPPMPPGPPVPPPGAVPVYPYGQASPPGYPQPPGLPSISRQLQAIELDELPAQYRIKPSGGSVALRIALVVVVLLGIAAAVVLVVRGGDGAERPRPSIVIDSSPAGATVIVDGLALPEKTPTVFRDTAPGKRHELELRLPGHKTYKDAVLIPDEGGEVRIMAPLLARTVSLTVKTTPPGADVLVDDHLEGTTAAGVGLTIHDLSPEAVTRVEVRLKGYAPKVDKVTWDEADEQRSVEFTFSK